MGLLGYALPSIKAGQRIEQKWQILAPQSAGSATFQTTTIHDDGTTTKCVTDAGSRKVTAFNVSLAEPGKLSIGRYSFVVDNTSGMAHPTTSGNWFYNSTGAYQAQPQECLVKHFVYVIDITTLNRTELTCVRYYGRIIDVEYDDGGRPGEAVPGTATIVSESGLAQAMRYKWSLADGDDVDTGRNIYQY